MNLSDIKENAIKLEIEVIKLDETINELKKIIEPTNLLFTDCINILVNRDIVGSSDSCIKNARTIKDSSTTYYASFLQSLREINFMESFFILADLKDKYEYFNINNFINEFTTTNEIIHRFISSKTIKESSEKFANTYKAIVSLINSYELVKNNIEQIKIINNVLVGSENVNNFKIRLMNENNRVLDLINNITIIKSMYDNINKLIGDESIELEYKRAESGTFEINLTGCFTTLSALLPTLTFIYKIYSENFSWKAKQDKQLGEIKIRKELFGLIRDENELNTQDNEIIQECLKNIELDGRILFINNPTIKLNDEKVGLDERTVDKISKEYIEANLPKLEEQEIALDKQAKEE
ncbi:MULTISPECIES: hypothetical protein [unclassified Clostridium]|uniref:hypothetical protein n=1 Tax=unclassified Clostridium TaxID=2614128 RepID=UPI00207A81BF|nr:MULTISPECIES: hypothetical protein [unclassified Clostridium]